ncbi:hypothetical protein [Acetobacter sp. AAB5]|uniref:hypothetical protein n=1 Tax=Acetobacter sp. AAB5 TaxID=3418370 RepID=UPI003CF3FD32
MRENANYTNKAKCKNITRHDSRSNFGKPVLACVSIFTHNAYRCLSKATANGNKSHTSIINSICMNNAVATLLICQRQQKESTSPAHPVILNKPLGRKGTVNTY